MYRIVEDWIHQNGVEIGFIILIAPVAYDLFGIAYGRDPMIKVETAGVVIQMFGAVLGLLSGILRSRYGK